MADEPHPQSLNDIRSIRRQLRRSRRALSDAQQLDHARRIERRLLGLPAFRNARRIAIYLDNDGEPRTAALIRRILACGKRCYLPVLRQHPKTKLWFCEYRIHDHLVPNRFGIPEPQPCRRGGAPAWGLDLVLMPLVGFDTGGNRIGMGGGFYDRTFAYLHRNRHWQRPRLVGLAHECQRLERIEARPWDIPLHGIVTEECYYSA